MQGYIGNRLQAEVSKCNVCFAQYDRRAKQPLVVCSMQHTICTECMRTIESNPRCPFCREAIDFRRIEVNQNIVDLLTREIHHGHTKHSLKKDGILPQRHFQNQAPIQVEFPRQNRARNSPVQLYGLQHNYLSSQPIVRPAPLSHTSQLPAETSNVNGDEDTHSEICACIQIRDSSRPLVHGAVFFGQLPFIFADILISILSQQSECMDIAHQQIVSLRAWLFICAFISTLLILVLKLSERLEYTNALKTSKFYAIERIVAVVFILKALLWSLILVQILQKTMIPYCSAGITAYGVVSAIYHWIFIVGLTIYTVLTRRCIY